MKYIPLAIIATLLVLVGRFAISGGKYLEESKALRAETKTLREDVKQAESRGRRQIMDLFAEDRVFLGPLVVTNDNVTISNVLVIYVPPTVLLKSAIHIDGDHSTIQSCSVTASDNLYSAFGWGSWDSDTNHVGHTLWDPPLLNIR